MTKAGKLEREFNIWKKDIEDRLAVLEATKNTKKSSSKIVIEAKDDIVATEEKTE